MATYGYARISTKKQKLETQERNIIEQFPEVKKIYKEAYTGTTQERTEWKKLLKQVKTGDTIIFDSVSRMARSADSGIKQYMELYEKGVNLVFLKERHLDTEIFKSATGIQISLTGDDVDDILIGLNSYLKKLAERQIRLGFEQAEKEVVDLRQRTKDGLKTAREQGRVGGRRKGAIIETNKSKQAKELILRHSKTFNGALNDLELMNVTKISRATLYKYKKEIKKDLGWR